jgi:hypothetical protein
LVGWQAIAVKSLDDAADMKAARDKVVSVSGLKPRSL